MGGHVVAGAVIEVVAGRGLAALVGLHVILWDAVRVELQRHGPDGCVKLIEIKGLVAKKLHVIAG